MDVITPVVKVDIGESTQTVKGLKDEISKLRDKILNLQVGSDDYADAVNQLQNNQRKLNQVMALTKKEAVALEGSYDALSHQMSQLKKEWKATNDEAQRNEIGKQIDVINSKLKEMDASVGNYQRNVGNYVSHWEGMPDAVDDVAASVKAANNEIKASASAPKDFGAAMREMNEEIEPTKQKFESISNIASGVASGFAAVQGAAALMGLENENLEKTLVKVQAAMALAQGIGGLKGIVEGVGKAKVAFSGLGDKIKAVSKVMGKAGWLAVILTVTTAVIGLVKWLKNGGESAEELAKKEEELAKKQEELKNLNEKLGGAIGNVVAEFNLLKSAYEKLNSLDEKKRWIEENAEAFKSLGLNIRDVNSADLAFIQNSPNVINALKARAKAEALMGKYKEEVVKAEEAKMNIDVSDVTLPNSFAVDYTLGGELTSSSKKSLAQYTKYGLKESDFEYVWGGGQSGYGSFKIKANSQWKLDEVNIKRRNEARKKATEAADANANKWLKVYEEALEEARAAAANSNEIVTPSDSTPNVDESSSSTSSGGESDVDIEKKKAQDLLKATGDYFKTKQELLTEKYNEDLALLQKYGLDTTNLTKKYQKELEELNKPEPVDYYEDVNEKIDALERGVNRELELNSISKLSDEEKAAEKYRIEKKLAEDKLALLEEYYKKAQADTNTEAETLTDLEQDIADQKIAIQKAAYDEEERLRQENLKKEEAAAQKKAEIYNNVQKSIVAASEFTQGILEVTQAAFEKDEEITEEEAKKIKGLQYAIASMNMLAGITAALSGAFTTKTGPWDYALGIAQAATIAATGTANLIKIRNTDLTGSTSGGGTGAAIPSASAYSSELPATYTRQVTGASEVESLNQDQRVYILESDIQASNKRVQVRESESSF